MVAALRLSALCPFLQWFGESGLRRESVIMHAHAGGLNIPPYHNLFRSGWGAVLHSTRSQRGRFEQRVKGRSPTPIGRTGLARHLMLVDERAVLQFGPRLSRQTGKETTRAHRMGPSPGSTVSGATSHTEHPSVKGLRWRAAVVLIT